MMSGVRDVMWVGGLLLLAALCCTPTHAHFGSCEDHTPSCSSWAAKGWCQSSKQFMLQNCPVSCNTCLDPGCFDRNRECSAYARRGFCKSQKKHMVPLCPHSCDACVIDRQTLLPITERKTITRPDFECGAPIATTTVNRKTRQINFPGEAIVPSQRLTSQNNTKDSDVMTMVPGTGLVNRMVPVTNDGVQVDDTFCGATPICDRYLLTAAHCVINPDRPVRTVRLGELDFAKDNEQNSRPVDYDIEQIIVHPDFDPDSRVRYNDVAILQTYDVIEFNEVVFPYCLSAERPAPKTVVTGAGFGFVNATFRSSRLQEVELEVVDSDNCESLYLLEGMGPFLELKYPQLIQNSDIMCASYPNRDACKGDSGGPLFVDQDSRRFLVGVVGSGVSCNGNGASVLPGFYISVADHIDFIDSVVYGDFK